MTNNPVIRAIYYICLCGKETALAPRSKFAMSRDHEAWQAATQAVVRVQNYANSAVIRALIDRLVEDN